MAGGPFTDPVDGAVFVFKDVPVAEVEEFVKTDPYVVNGLVPKWSAASRCSSALLIPSRFISGLA